MTARFAHTLTLIAAITAPMPAAGVLLFDQQPNVSSFGNGMNISDFLVGGTAVAAATSADDFELPQDAVLERMNFWAAQAPTTQWGGTLEYAIWVDTGAFAPLNTPLASGTGQNVVATPTGATGSSAVIGAFDQYEYSFDLESTVGLSGNTRYWISVYLGQISDPSGNKVILWQQTGSSGMLPSLIDGSPHLATQANLPPPRTWNGGAPGANLNTAFQLFGSSVPTPPVSLLLIGPLAFLMARRRRA